MVVNLIDDFFHLENEQFGDGLFGDVWGPLVFGEPHVWKCYIRHKWTWRCASVWFEHHRAQHVLLEKKRYPHTS